MKRFFLIISIIVLGTLAVFARKNPGEKVGVTIENMVYDFGTVSDDSGDVTHEFTFDVTGSSPVAILSATANCGCTTPQYDRKPTMPGKTGKVKVSFVPKGQRGEIDKDIRVKFRSGNGAAETVTLRLTGVVIPKK